MASALLMKSFREFVRRQKNNCIQTYFHARIYGTAEPYRIWGRSQPLRILLILSHMRSGSSLLTHLLNNNPAILGYGETHLTYGSSQDFKKLMEKVYWQCHEFRNLKDLKNLRMDHQYILDKILHNARIPDPNLLVHPQISVLFLIREPVRSILSLRDLKPHLSHYESFAYYKERLTALVRYSQHINNPEKAMVLTYDQLLNNTEEALKNLQTFLNTQMEFSEQYGLLKTTGMKGIGDSKGRITAGKIIRTQRALSEDIPQDIMEESKTFYDSVYRSLATSCTAGASFPH